MSWYKGFPPECDSCHGRFDWSTVIEVTVNSGANDWALDFCSAKCIITTCANIPEDTTERDEFCVSVARAYAERNGITMARYE